MLRCLCNETVSEHLPSDWSQRLYAAKAAELILYDWALGLSHAESEELTDDSDPGFACCWRPLLKNHNSDLRNSAPGESAMTLGQSNQSLPNFPKRLIAPARNASPNERIEWTNHDAFTSSISSFLPATAN